MDGKRGFTIVRDINFSPALSERILLYTILFSPVLNLSYTVRINEYGLGRFRCHISLWQAYSCLFCRYYK